MKSLPKLSIRDLLWLIVVVVLSVLLWKQHKETANLARELTKSRQEQEVARQSFEESQLAAGEKLKLFRNKLREQMNKMSMMKSAQGSATASGANP